MVELHLHQCSWASQRMKQFGHASPILSSCVGADKLGANGRTKDEVVFVTLSGCTFNLSLMLNAHVYDTRHHTTTSLCTLTMNDMCNALELD